jgi:hypothetical protein
MDEGSIAPRARRPRWWTAGGRRDFALLRRSAIRGVGVFLATLAVLVQLWLPSLHQAAMAHTVARPAYARLVAIFGGKPALCLASAKGLSAIPGKAPSHKPPVCVICLTMQVVGTFVPPESISVAAGMWPELPRVRRVSAPFVARRLNTTSRSRAPPAAA